MLDAAREYLARGWSVIPLYAPRDDGTCTCSDPACASQGKHPAVPDFSTYHKRRATLDEIESWFGRGEPRNIGIPTGTVSGGLVVIDCDDAATYGAMCYAYPELRRSLTVESGKGFHIYCMAPKPPALPLGTVTFVANGLRHHVQSDGRQVVAPPSIHKTGRRYAFRDPTALPLVLDLERLKAALAAIGGKKEGVAQGTSSSEYAQWWREGAKQGERDERTFRMAAHLLYRGVHVDEAEEILTLWAETRCMQSPSDPWGRDQVRAKLRSASSGGSYQTWQGASAAQGPA